MEKKTYIRPHIEAYKVQAIDILAGSPLVGGGSTIQQNAKGMNFFDDELTDEDIIGLSFILD